VNTIEGPTWNVVKYFTAWCQMCETEREFDSQSEAEKFVKEHTESCYKVATSSKSEDA
jgi:hypothetical protein